MPRIQNAHSTTGDQAMQLAQATVTADCQQSADASTEAGQPQPRPTRSRQKSRADRGLPDDTELTRLAQAYLERQAKHYSDKVGSPLIPMPTPAVIAMMVEDFKARHRGGAVDGGALRTSLKAAGFEQCAGGYFRYSCDNSNPTSIIDQMVNCLDKAASLKCFLPWQYVYADFSVTGLDSSRQGYSAYKTLLASKDQPLEMTLIDDFTRASRDELEWWKLAALSKRLRKDMFGASDGFSLVSRTGIFTSRCTVCYRVSS